MALDIALSSLVDIDKCFIIPIMEVICSSEMVVSDFVRGQMSAKNIYSHDACHLRLVTYLLLSPVLFLQLFKVLL